MKDTIEIELPIMFTIEFAAYKAEPMTRHYPGDPAHIEILTISQPSLDDILKDHEDEIMQECWDAVAEMQQEAAERKYDDLRNR